MLLQKREYDIASLQYCNFISLILRFFFSYSSFRHKPQVTYLPFCSSRGSHRLFSSQLVQYSNLSLTSKKNLEYCVLLSLILPQLVLILLPLGVVLSLFWVVSTFFPESSSKLLGSMWRALRSFVRKFYFFPSMLRCQCATLQPKLEYCTS